MKPGTIAATAVQSGLFQEPQCPVLGLCGLGVQSKCDQLSQVMRNPSAASFSMPLCWHSELLGYWEELAWAAEMVGDGSCMKSMLDNMDVCPV